MRQKNRGVMFVAAVFIVAIAAVTYFLSRNPGVSTAPSGEHGQMTDGREQAGELEGPVADMVEQLQKAREDLAYINGSLTQRRTEREVLMTRINELLDDRDLLMREVAELRERHRTYVSRRQAEIAEMTEHDAKVANFKDGTVFFAPSCGTGTDGRVYRVIAKDEVRTGHGPCMPLEDRTFFLGVDAGGEASGTMTKPVKKRIPNAIAPYRPRQDLQDAQRIR